MTYIDCYLPRKVKTAMPRARMAAIMVKGAAARAGTKAAKPYHRKNRIVHQLAIDLGMTILISPCVVAGRITGSYLLKHGFLKEVAHSWSEFLF